MEKHQSDVLPMRAIKTHKVWFEYLPNDKEPKKSQYRCRLCNKYFYKMNFPSQFLSLFANNEGVLKDTKKQNADLIYDNSKSKIHLNIIANLKEYALTKKYRSNHFEKNSGTPQNDHLKVTAKIQCLF